MKLECFNVWGSSSHKYYSSAFTVTVRMCDNTIKISEGAYPSGYSATQYVQANDAGDLPTNFQLPEFTPSACGISTSDV